MYSSKSLCIVSICEGVDKLLFNQTTTGRQSSFLLACLLVNLCECFLSSIYILEGSTEQRRMKEGKPWSETQLDRVVLQL